MANVTAKAMVDLTAKKGKPRPLTVVIVVVVVGTAAAVAHQHSLKLHRLKRLARVEATFSKLAPSLAGTHLAATLVQIELENARLTAADSMAAACQSVGEQAAQNN